MPAYSGPSSSRSGLNAWSPTWRRRSSSRRAATFRSPCSTEPSSPSRSYARRWVRTRGPAWRSCGSPKPAAGRARSWCEPEHPLSPSCSIDRAVANFADPVVLVRSPFRVTFSYAGADRVWQRSWRDASQLPRAVRVTVRDDVTRAHARGLDRDAGSRAGARGMYAPALDRRMPGAPQARGRDSDAAARAVSQRMFRRSGNRRRRQRPAMTKPREPSPTRRAAPGGIHRRGGAVDSRRARGAGLDLLGLRVVNTATAIASHKDRLQGEALVTAGVELAAHRITATPQQPPSNGAFTFRLGSASVAVRFLSETARIDLNAAPKELLIGLFASLGASRDAEYYADRIIGWRTPRPSGRTTRPPPIAPPVCTTRRAAACFPMSASSGW